MLGILDEYGTEPHHRERERVQLAILTLSRGDLDELRTLVTTARRDYRDVLYWTELAAGRRDPLADRFTEALLTPEATPRRLALLHEVIPTATRVGVLSDAGYPSHAAQLAELESTARGLGLTTHPIAVARPDGLDEAFSAMRRHRDDALLVLTSTMLQYHLAAIAERSLAARLPAVGELREFAVAGGLLSFGLTEATRRDRARGSMAALVDRLKRQPAAAPVPEVAPALVVNLRTASALGLDVPDSIRRRAAELIR